MKETVKITSVLCGIAALVSLIAGIRCLMGHSAFISLVMFSMVRQGTVTGFMGNLVSVALTAIGFGSMAFFGLTGLNSNSRARKAFVWGLVMTGLCALSLLCSIFAHSFNFGDIILLILPAVYTFAVLKSA